MNLSHRLSKRKVTLLATLKKSTEVFNPNPRDVHFSITGKHLTKLIRGFCLEGNPIHAWKVFSTLTDNVEIFRQLIRGTHCLDGRDDFRLVACSQPNIVEETFEILRRNKEAEIDPRDLDHEHGEYSETDQIMRYHSEYEADSELDEDYEPESFDVGAYNQKIKEKEAKRIAQIKCFGEKMNLTLEQIEELHVRKLHKEDWDHPHGGWITDKGSYLPLEHHLHDQHLEMLFNQGYLFNWEVKDFERRWVRVSSDLVNNVIRGMNIAAYNFNMTGKQKITLAKIIKVKKLLKDPTDQIHILGYGTAFLNDSGEVEFKRQAQNEN